LFRALLVFIMFDLAVDWLWYARLKLSFVEYVNLWASLLLVIVFDLELGMLLGCLVCAVGFVVTYARATSFEFVEGRARVVRTRYHSAVLKHAQQSHALSCIQLTGYIFFGSSQAIVSQVAFAMDHFQECLAEDLEMEAENPRHQFLQVSLCVILPTVILRGFLTFSLSHTLSTPLCCTTTGCSLHVP
jgi:MFS superfamily sulfate permease-like transporter